MMDVFTPPPERDLPTARVAEMRASVMAGIDRGAPDAGRVPRAVLAGAAAIALVAGFTAALTMDRDEPARVLAFAPGELSPELAAAVDRCLYWNSPQSQDPSSLAHYPQVPVTANDFVVGVQRGDDRAVAFVTGDGYLTCEYTDTGGGSGATTVNRWEPGQRDWLPGPLERLLLTSSEADGGDVAVIGRASAAVHRVVLEYGDGHSSEARLENGVFALLSDGSPVTQDKAALAGYDANGREVGRVVLFEARDSDVCFTDPAGVVVYGVAGSDCRPAYRWR